MMVKRQARERWLEAGVAVLARDGGASLTIDALCHHLGLTKGSFYHHFPNHQAYVTALLEHWEQGTLDIIAESDAAGEAVARLERLAELITTRGAAPLEVAIRAWAAHDALVRSVQQRVDTRRIGYLSELMQAFIADPSETAVFAQLIYAVFVGAQHLFPPIEGEALRRIYRYLDPKRLSAAPTPAFTPNQREEP